MKRFVLLFWVALLIGFSCGCRVEQKIEPVVIEAVETVEEPEEEPVVIETAETVEELEEEPVVKYVQVQKTLIKVDPNPDKGFYLPYYLSIPTLRVPEGQPIYLLVESNGSHPASDDFAFHEERALQIASKSWSYWMSQDLGIPLMVPVIPRPPGNVMYQVLNRQSLQVTSGQLARVDLQVIAMITDARERLAEMEVSTEEKVLFNGYSNSGNFGTRFAILHPEVVAAVAGGGNCALPLPIEEWKGEELTYNVGVGDLGSLIGKQFNSEEFSRVTMFVYIGGDDPQFQDDLAKYNGWYTRNQADQIWRLFGYDVKSRWEQTQEIYNEHFPNVRFMTYERVGHEVTEEISRDVFKFFKEIISNQ